MRLFDRTEEVAVPDVHLAAQAAGNGLGEAEHLGYQPVSALSLGDRAKL
ncbi:hypothetical protein IVB16_31865 [Bradyrhizobium sp. 183]|nr:MULTISPECIES: hypothetical protein [unclassified Bradyrhizobium]UPJ79312.1 hypothetical protein IVB17_31865 [Bradyrhizobium sp. 184]UPJ87106.1 hypothetical protein IVB16_31865 [Bradyrhizobium sp. 183]